MNGMIDPVTLASLAIGIMTGAAFTLVVAFADNSGARRFKRRLDAIKTYRARRRVEPIEETPARSLARQGSATPRMDRLVRRWLPQRNMLALRLEQTGRSISIGQFMMAVLGLGAIGFISAFGIFHFGGLPSVLLAVAVGI